MYMHHSVQLKRQRPSTSEKQIDLFGVCSLPAPIPNVLLGLYRKAGLGP